MSLLGSERRLKGPGRRSRRVASQQARWWPEGGIGAPSRPCSFPGVGIARGERIRACDWTVTGQVTLLAADRRSGRRGAVRGGTGGVLSATHQSAPQGTRRAVTGFDREGPTGWPRPSAASPGLADLGANPTPQREREPTPSARSCIGWAGRVNDFETT
jgi:hypothetical protein